MKKDRPYFLWDYDLSEDDVRRILSGGNGVEKRWMMGRLLEAARFEDVWKYLTLKDVADNFSSLKLREPVRRTWQRALKIWSEQPR